MGFGKLGVGRNESGIEVVMAGLSVERVDQSEGFEPPSSIQPAFDSLR